MRETEVKRLLYQDSEAFKAGIEVGRKETINKAVEWIIENFADYVGADVPHGYELQEDGYFSWVQKKPKYPQSYEECSKVLLDRASVRNDLGYKGDLIVSFQKLLVCRDAYWKIAGEEMGLGKPWKPDWRNNKYKYFLYLDEGVICKDDTTDIGHMLSFPTEEMRDAFKESEEISKLIEECKELL